MVIVFSATAWFGPGRSAKTSESIGRISLGTARDASVWLVSYSVDRALTESKGDISIRGAREDRIAAYKLECSYAKALQVTEQR